MLILSVETFTPVGLDRYLPIGTLKSGMDEKKIQAVDKNPNNSEYNLLSNNREDLAVALCRNIIDGEFPVQAKERAKVYPVNAMSLGEAFVKVEVRDGFDDPILYDSEARLGQGSGTVDIDKIIKDGK